ncbi:MAG TPA: ATP-dependent 6-phosphofructokinase [Bryobacteraceae bacterium]|nr:ATP-dependent 6-phosphofructokinase [Bryobacteraceae bacterium]
MLTPQQLAVPNLGPRLVRSPLKLSTLPGDGLSDFTPNDARLLYRADFVAGEDILLDLSFEKAGPREMIYFDPARTVAAIVTCGGLCPGLNNVIRSVFLQLHHNYGVTRVLGIRYGYAGLNPARGVPPVQLTPELVESIHKLGGTVLGTSRGPEDPRVMVDFLESQGVNLLLAVGGDGTQRGAHAVAEEARSRRLDLAVVGIPKTIDNDLPYVWESFGYRTALETASEVLDCAHAEAKGVRNGISLVKLMGRYSGSIAAGATLASQEVNFTLVPEIPFSLTGENGFLGHLKRRILNRGHAVIVVAEGAGQELAGAGETGRDASGNLKLRDIGPWLRQSIVDHFAAEHIPIVVRYFDPSYVIRSVPANTYDSLLCDRLARYAVHAAMAGKTDVLMGMWYNSFIHVPIRLATSERKLLRPESDAWRAVLAATGQPAKFGPA